MFLESLPLLALFFWLPHSSLPALERIGEFLEARVRTPIWHSGKHRAQQTAEILAGAVSASQGMRQRNGLAPKDPVAPVKQAIEQWAGDLMIVSHLPFLGKLTALLVADNEETEIVAFRFGCVVCVERIEDGPRNRDLERAAPPATRHAPQSRLCRGYRAQEFLRNI